MESIETEEKKALASKVKTPPAFKKIKNKSFFFKFL